MLVDYELFYGRVFQFQIGAIKSSGTPYTKDEVIRGFNSKLVRLKGPFNPTEIKAFVKFQFQTGSIKSLPTSSDVNTAAEGFNSKLVRLKVAGTESAVAGHLCGFQFQTGSIKRGQYITDVELVYSSFNSKLVRLKANHPFPTGDFCTCFNSKLVRLKAAT